MIAGDEREMMGDDDVEVVGVAETGTAVGTAVGDASCARLAPASEDEIKPSETKIPIRIMLLLTGKG
ncbi:MAG: hypothetical protein JF612_12860 [Planctomycetia bacterium]|nr:hypothetical protein [Planctomycetia bacterium]